MVESTGNGGNRCGHGHDWFSTDQKRAILTVRRWANWLDLDPYLSGRLDTFWDAILFETTSFKSLDTFHHWIERVTEDCSQRGEKSWRGRADGRFQNFNESFGEETQSPPVSPVASVFSTDAHSMVSGTTLDSTLPDEQIMRAVEELVTLLLEDEDFQHLQAAALARTNPEKFERNFLRLLRMYAVELQTEASAKSEYQAVRFIKTRAPEVARCLRSQLDPSMRETSEIWKSLLKQESEKQESLQRYLRDLSWAGTETCGLGSEAFESSSSYGPDGAMLDNLMPDYVLHNIELDVVGSLDFPNFEKVKEFMVQSKAFSKLRDDLTAFVFPPNEHILKGLRETVPEKLTSLSSIESSPSSFEHDHDYAEFENKTLFSDPKREQVGAAANRPISHMFKHWIRKQSEGLVFCCLRAVEDLGMYKSLLCKGFIRLNWTCLCEQLFSQDYPESQLNLAQQLQFMLLQSGYQATILAHNKEDTKASHVLPPSLSNIAQTSALSGDMDLDMQTSNSHSAPVNTATVPGLYGGTTSQGTNFRIDPGRNNTSSLGSLATNPHIIDDVLKDQAWKLRDQWLLLCFYHNKRVSRAVHMKVSEESHDVDLIRSFQKEYAVARGIFSYYLSWKRVTNIKLVRFRLTKDPYFEADLTTETEIPERNAIVEDRPIKMEENANKGSGIDLALIDDDWGPPEGWCDKKHWEPCPVDPRPNLEHWMMHLWEHPHNSQLYLALKRMHVRLATSGEPIISRYRKSGSAKLRELSNNIRNLCPRFGYFRGRTNRLDSIKDIELQNSIAEIPHPRQAELDQLQQPQTKKGRFVAVNTPKKILAKLKADLDEPPYGWGLFFEERTVVPTFIKIFIFFCLISLMVYLAVTCFKLAHEHGYAAFGM